MAQNGLYAPFYPPLEEFDLVIFDCDGTLVDSMPLHYQSWLEGFSQNGSKETFPEDLFYSLAGSSAQDVVNAFNRQSGQNLEVEKIVKIKETHFLSALKEVPLIHPVVGYARRLKRLLPKVPRVVVSGSSRELVHKTLAAARITHLFDLIITPEDVAEGQGKPAPDMLLLAAEKYDATPHQCLVLEDGGSGIEAVRAAKMNGIFVKSRPPV